MRDLTPDQRTAARKALGAYGGTLGRRLRHGENTIFAVADRPWVVRVHRPDYHDDLGLRSELMLVRAVRDAGFAVAGVIEARDGSTLQHANGYRITVIEHLPGQHRRKLGRTRCVELGRLMRALHTFAREWTPPAAFKRPQWSLEGILGPDAAWGSMESGGLDPSLAEDLRADLRPRLQHRTEAIPLHFDLHAGNILWVGPTAHLIDWDDSGIGDPLFDLAIPWMRLDADHQACLMRGYGAFDVSLLPAAKIAMDSRALGWLYSRRDVRGFDALLESYRTRFVEQARRWLDQ